MVDHLYVGVDLFISFSYKHLVLWNILLFTSLLTFVLPITCRDIQDILYRLNILNPDVKNLRTTTLAVVACYLEKQLGWIFNIFSKQQNLDMFSWKYLTFGLSLPFRTTLMWQRPTRIAMGCKFVVLSNFWKSRRKREFCNDYRIRLKGFHHIDIVLWTLLIIDNRHNRTQNIRN